MAAPVSPSLRTPFTPHTTPPPYNNWDSFSATHNGAQWSGIFYLSAHLCVWQAGLPEGRNSKVCSRNNRQEDEDRVPRIILFNFSKWAKRLSWGSRLQLSVPGEENWGSVGSEQAGWWLLREMLDKCFWNINALTQSERDSLISLSLSHIYEYKDICINRV